jgi:hypothetical protein
MVNGNFFPPIAFLFRRTVHDQVGGYDETLPVLGDWDFNLRFLLKADIGVLPKPLAYYHHRDVGGTSAAYSNSVIGGIDKHLEYSSIVRNKYIRNAEYGALAALVSAGYGLTDLRNRLGGVQRSISSSLGDRLAREIKNQSSVSDWLLDQTSWVADERWVKIQLLTWAARSNQSKQADHDDACDLATPEMRQLIQTLKLPLEPPPDFNEAVYRSSNGDVDAAIRGGQFASGFHHYFLFGREEGRARPSSIAAPVT